MVLQFWEIESETFDTRKNWIVTEMSKRYICGVINFAKEVLSISIQNTLTSLKVLGGGEGGDGGGVTMINTTSYIMWLLIIAGLGPAI